jgi:hypothetical protein
MRHNKSTKKSTTDIFIARAKEIHGNKFDYSKVIYNNNRTKVIIICREKNHEFLQSPETHLKLKKCPKCSGFYNFSREEWIEIIRERHKNKDGTYKYDYSKADYKGSSTKVTIICKSCNNEFLQTPNGHKRQGCPKCAAYGYHYTNDEYIEKVKKIHGDKYDYSKTNYTMANKKIIIICKNNKHGEFEIKAASHMFGQGCQKCTGNYTYKKEEWIDIVSKIHNNKYNYDKVIYINNTTPVTITCPKHGDFNQKPYSHTIYGCPGVGCGNAIKNTTEGFIKSAKEKHGDKYDYSNAVYKTNTDLVEIFCKKHNIAFFQQASIHLGGSGCPYCVNKTEGLFYAWIKQYFEIIEGQPKFDWCKSPISNHKLPFDFYIEEINCIIEIDGRQHFKQVKNWGDCEITAKRDVFKMQRAIENNLTIIRIFQEDIFKYKEKWLDDVISPLLIKLCLYKLSNYEDDNKIYYVTSDKNKELYNKHKEFIKNIVEFPNLDSSVSNLDSENDSSSACDNESLDCPQEIRPKQKFIDIRTKKVNK